MGAAPSRDSSGFLRATADAGLTLMQTRLVAELYARRGKAVFRDEIMDALYPDVDRSPFREVVRVMVCHIRAKLGGDLIATIARPRWGYALAPHAVAWLDDASKQEAA